MHYLPSDEMKETKPKFCFIPNSQHNPSHVVVIFQQAANQRLTDPMLREEQGKLNRKKASLDQVDTGHMEDMMCNNATSMFSAFVASSNGIMKQF